MPKTKADFWLEAASRIAADVADDARFAVHSGPQARIDHIDVMQQKIDSVAVLLKAAKAHARAAHAEIKAAS